MYARGSTHYVCEGESGVRGRIRLLRYIITMGSVTIPLIYMGNLFVINKIFTCGNICTNDD